MASLELKVPPPLVGLTTALLMWLGSHVFPSFAWAAPGRIVIALLLGGLGLAIDVAAIVSFLRARTTVDPRRPVRTSSLVTTGIYRLTRNPMYVGLVLVLLGWATFLANALAFLLVPVLVLYLTRFQIAPEERHLADHFGAAYDDYRARVPRWL